MRPLLCLVVVACSSTPVARERRSAPPPPAPAPRPPSELAIDAERPGRLVLEQSGRAWRVTCDGTNLTRQPWQGGDAEAIGTCDYEEPIARSTAAYVYETRPIAMDGTSVAIVDERAHALVVTRQGRAKQYPIVGRVAIVALAFDGSAVVAVVTSGGQGADVLGGVSLGRSLSAIVRLDDAGDHIVELARWGATTAAVVPAYAAMGPDHMLLVDDNGLAITCDYQLRCDQPPHPLGVRVDGALALVDGGMITRHFDAGISRLDAEGRVVWTRDVPVFELVGATTDHVWVAHGDDTGATSDGLPVTAFSLDAGDRDREQAAIEYSAKRDPFGRYLVIRGVATTPRGTVVRGYFGGVLETDDARIETAIHGALCWWENPHNGHEYPIDVDGVCREQHAKAIETGRRAFVSIGADHLRSPHAHD